MADGVNHFNNGSILLSSSTRVADWSRRIFPISGWISSWKSGESSWAGLRVLNFSQIQARQCMCASLAWIFLDARLSRVPFPRKGRVKCSCQSWGQWPGEWLANHPRSTVSCFTGCLTDHKTLKPSDWEFLVTLTTEILICSDDVIKQVPYSEITTPYLNLSNIYIQVCTFNCVFWIWPTTFNNELRYFLELVKILVKLALSMT